MHLTRTLCFTCMVACSVPLQWSHAQSNDREKIVAKAIDYLKVRGQGDDGSVSPRIGIGLTALAATAMIQNDVPLNDPAVSKALELVENAARENGGIYPDNSRLMMYETSVAIMCLESANQDGKYDEILAKAAAFLKGEQFDEEKGVDASQIEYGGAGYGGKSRPDLSNTAYFIEALESLGDPEHDEAIRKALIFVSRCQNLESEYNTTEGASKVNDGGFFYNVTDGGVSAAGETADGGLRSYGSMTYAGFKSFLHAGMDPADERVKAAITWIENHYSVVENPGLGDAGLYYYYHLMAKALSLAEIDELKDADGESHDWRAELIEHLGKIQEADGSWINGNKRWMESDPNLATTFALLALSYCKPTE